VTLSQSQKSKNTLPPSGSSAPQTRSPLGFETKRILFSVGFLIVLYVVIGLINPVEFSPKNLSAMAQSGSILLLVSLGATFVVMMGMIDRVPSVTRNDGNRRKVTIAPLATPTAIVTTMANRIEKSPMYW